MELWFHMKGPTLMSIPWTCTSPENVPVQAWSSSQRITWTAWYHSPLWGQELWLCPLYTKGDRYHCSAKVLYSPKIQSSKKWRHLFKRRKKVYGLIICICNKSSHEELGHLVYLPTSQFLHSSCSWDTYWASLDQQILILALLDYVILCCGKPLSALYNVNNTSVVYQGTGDIPQPPA